MVERYDAILDDHIFTNVVMLVVLFLVVAGVIALLVFFVRHKKAESDEEKICSGEDITIIVLKIVVIMLCLIVGSKCVVDIVHCCEDKAEQSYVIVDKTFLLKSREYGVGLWMNGDQYSIVYEENGEAIEIVIDTQYCNWDVGRYTDSVFVYSARSKILLDVWEK